MPVSPSYKYIHNTGITPMYTHSPARSLVHAHTQTHTHTHTHTWVIDIGRMKDGDYKYVQDDIAGVVKAAKEAGAKNVIHACTNAHTKYSHGTPTLRHLHPLERYSHARALLRSSRKYPHTHTSSLTHIGD